MGDLLSKTMVDFRRTGKIATSEYSLSSVRRGLAPGSTPLFPAPEKYTPIPTSYVSVIPPLCDRHTQSMAFHVFHDIRWLSDFL